MIELRSYQREAIESLYDWFNKNDTGNPLLVLPTGAGKSLIAAKICEDALSFPNQRVLLLTHVRELIEQNFLALLRLWPEAPAGIYCAGLKKKQAHNPITFASIQSVHKKADLIGWRDLIIIDECHLVGDTDGTMYRTFLTRMQEINPHIRIVGLSATPYRLKTGFLHIGPDAMFSDIAFELPIARLVQEGYLAPLVGKSAVGEVDTKNIALLAGEFSAKEVDEVFNVPAMIKGAVKEIMEFGHGRKSWLLFCISISHAHHVRDAMLEAGIPAATVSQETPSAERAQILADYKAGRIRAITNVSVLTTGFDAPSTDLLVLLRPTMSPGLLVQMAGRGMRLAEGKENCLVLDFAGNLVRHGPITHIKPPKEGKRKKDDEEGIICPQCRIVSPAETEVCECGQILNGKKCSQCKTVVVASAKECTTCGYVFPGVPREINHSIKASSAEVMSLEPKVSDKPDWFKVLKIFYDLHEKPGVPPSMKVTYKIPHNTVMEWVGFANPKEYPRKLAATWWLSRGGNQPVPLTAEDALGRLEELQFYPAKIQVKRDGEWKRVMSCNLIKSDIPLSIEIGNLGEQLVQETIYGKQTV